MSRVHYTALHAVHGGAMQGRPPPAGPTGGPAVSRPEARPRHADSWVLPIADGALIGAIAGLGTVAALLWAPWWLLEVVAFLTAPVLLAQHLLEPQATLVTALAIVGGTMLLYSAYAEAILHSRTEEIGAIRFMVLLLLHAACLIAWIGMAIGSSIERLVL